VNFTGVNIAALGFETLASFVATQSKVSTFAAKLTGKRSRSVEIDFTVSPNPLPSTRKINVVDPTTNKVTEITYNCANNAYANNPLASLYLRDWLTNYFETINTTPGYQHYPETKYPTDEVARAIRDIVRPEAIPAQFKIQSVDLTTSFQVAVDLSAGASPTLLGNGTVFIVPVSGVGFDYNPDYIHKIDINLKMCDTAANTDTKKNERYAADVCGGGKDTSTKYSPRLDRQCEIYADIVALIPGVTPPRDYYDGPNCKGHCTCNKYQGIYVRRKTLPFLPPA
jgi:hypothetical protein